MTKTMSLPFLEKQRQRQALRPQSEKLRQKVLPVLKNKKNLVYRSGTYGG